MLACDQLVDTNQCDKPAVAKAPKTSYGLSDDFCPWWFWCQEHIDAEIARVAENHRRMAEWEALPMLADVLRKGAV